MKRAVFFENVQSIIEDVLMSAQGSEEIAGTGPYTAQEAAIDITALLPGYVWSDD